MAIRGGKVRFEYEYEDPRDGDAEPVVLEVEAEVSDYHPAVRYLRNGDPGYPAEGGEVEDLRAFGPDGEVDLDGMVEVVRRFDVRSGRHVRAEVPLAEVLEDRVHERFLQGDVS